MSSSLNSGKSKVRQALKEDLVFSEAEREANIWGGEDDCIVD